MITKCCWPQDGFRHIHMPPRNGPCQHPGEGLLLMTGAFAPHQHTLLRWLPQSPWQLLFHSLPGRALSSLEDTPAQVPQTKKGNLANSFPFWSFPLTTSKGSPWFLNATIWSQAHVTSQRKMVWRIQGLKHLSCFGCVPHHTHSRGSGQGVRMDISDPSLALPVYWKHKEEEAWKLNGKELCRIWKSGWSGREKVMKCCILQSMMSNIIFHYGQYWCQPERF